MGGNFSSVLLFVLFRSMGNAFHRKEELTVQRSKSACCEVSLIYSFILYIWCPHFSHLLGLSHLNKKKEMIISAINVYREQQNQPIFNSFVLLTQMQARWHLFGDNLSHKLPFQFSIYALLYYKLFRFIHLSVLSGDLSGPVGLPQTPYAVTST